MYKTRRCDSKLKLSNGYSLEDIKREHAVSLNTGGHVNVTIHIFVTVTEEQG